MGIPEFYGEFLRPTLDRLELSYIYKKPVDRSAVDNLFIDANGLFYYAYLAASGQVGEKQNQTVVARMEKKSDTKILEDLEGYLRRFILKLVEHFNPKRGFYFCVDGKVPAAKIQQQRVRRYTSSIHENEKEKDMTGYVSPFTSFMFKIDEYLDRIFSKNREFFPQNLYYSSFKQVGEGEHKIMKLLAEVPEQYNIVHSMDADLLMLLLVRPELESTYLVRDSTNKLEVWNMIDMVNLRLAIPKILKLDDSEQACNDFVVLIMLIGNDFLPQGPLPHSETKVRCQALVDAYIQVEDFLVSENQIQFENLQKILALVVDQEIDLVAKAIVNQPEHRMYKQVVESTGKNVMQFDWAAFVNAWYYEILAPKTIPLPNLNYAAMVEQMCLDYFSTMSWVWQYYQDWQSVSSTWFYPKHYAPLLQQLATVDVSKLDRDVSNKPGEEDSFGPLAHLLAIIPPMAGPNNLPSFLRKVQSDTSSMVADQFPLGAIVIPQGRREHKALVPMADLKRLDQAARLAARTSRIDLKLYSNDTDEENYIATTSLEQTTYDNLWETNRQIYLRSRERQEERNTRGSRNDRGGYRGNNRGSYRGNRGRDRNDTRDLGNRDRNDTRNSYRNARNTYKSDNSPGRRIDTSPGRRIDTSPGRRIDRKNIPKKQYISNLRGASNVPSYMQGVDEY